MYVTVRGQPQALVLAFHLVETESLVQHWFVGVAGLEMSGNLLFSLSHLLIVAQ